MSTVNEMIALTEHITSSLQAVVYGDEHLVAIRNCVKNRKGLLEFVEYGSIKPELDNCLAILESEKAAPAPDPVV